MNKKNRIIIAVLIPFLMIIAVMSYIIYQRIRDEVVEEAGQVLTRKEQQTELSYGDQTFPLKKRIETFLLVGTDSDQTMASDDHIKLFYNHIQADAIVLFVVDNEAQKVTAIQINRDTMMDDPWLDVIGNYGGTSYEQIALSYNSGSGGLDSCLNTKRAVSSLLFNAPIDHCLAFTMAGINTLNDLVGGVTVNIVDDLTPVDPMLAQGKKITLHGVQAEHFLRARQALQDDTNTSRMRRHRDYFEGFRDSAETAFEADPEFLLKAMKQLNPYMVTDMSAQAISDLVSKVNKYGFDSIRCAKGELRATEFYEFYADMDDLWSIVSEAYCDKY